MLEISKVLFEITFVVHGYHVYKGIFEVEINTELHCLPESDNRKDHHARVIF